MTRESVDAQSTERFLIECSRPTARCVAGLECFARALSQYDTPCPGITLAPLCGSKKYDVSPSPPM